MIKIIYEDNHIIVVEKPANIPTQADSSKDKDMLSLIKEYLKEKYNKPGNVYLGLVHRLDRPVGGLMVFAKTSKGASRLSEQIRNNDFHKSYYAVVENKFDETSGYYEDKIKKLENGNSVIANDGNIAKLKYKVLKSINNNNLIEIDLITGRHHQIRVQMAHHNHPLCGDQRYNKQDKTQIALFAYKLEFFHPISKKRMIFELKPMRYGHWKQFEIL